MTEEECEITDIDYLQMIENQLNVVGAVIEYPDDTYDNMAADKIKTISLAFRLIQKVQRKLLETV